MPCTCDGNVQCLDPAMVKGVGDECISNADCLTGYCVVNIVKTCKLKEGQGCFTDADCVSGDCDDTYHCTQIMP